MSVAEPRAWTAQCNHHYYIYFVAKCSGGWCGLVTMENVKKFQRQVLRIVYECVYFKYTQINFWPINILALLTLTPPKSHSKSSKTQYRLNIHPQNGNAVWPRICNSHPIVCQMHAQTKNYSNFHKFPFLVFSPLKCANNEINANFRGKTMECVWEICSFWSSIFVGQIIFRDSVVCSCTRIIAHNIAGNESEREAKHQKIFSYGPHRNFSLWIFIK